MVARTLRRVSVLGRVVLFDYRGFGVSDPVPLERVGELDELSHDLSAVVTELAGSPTAVVATGTSTMPSVTLAVQQPTALDRMVLLNATATSPIQDPAQVIADVRERWGTGTGTVLVQGAGLPVEDGRRKPTGHNERISASPAVAEAYFRALQRHDVRPLLPEVAVPTLVVYTGDSARITPAMSEEVASRIPGAAHVLRPSSLFNWGDWDTDIKRFLTGDDGDSLGQRDLATVVFTDIVGSTARAARLGDAVWRKTIASVDGFVEQEVVKGQGRVVKQTGDGHLLEFARPADALRCAERLAGGAPGAGVTLRIGVHYGEVERRPNGDIGGLAVHLAARIGAAAGPSEILVSRTVAELTVGDGRRYEDRGTHVLKGLPGEWQLLALTAKADEQHDG